MLADHRNPVKGEMLMARCAARVKRIGVALALVLSIGQSAGAGQASRPDGPIRIGFAQYPSISPDGSLIVFSWAGDLWAVAPRGGPASRLTSHPAEERRSAFSPDGKWLVFESDRDGARNLYRFAITHENGGVATDRIKRITVSDRSQTLGSYSADGEEIFFAGSHELAIYRHALAYRVPAAGGPVTRLSDAFATVPHASPDGSSVIVTRGRYDFNRPAYHGPGAMDVYRIALNDGSFTQLTAVDANDGDAFALPDGSVVFISARDGQNNLFRLDPGATDDGRMRPPGLHQLTRFAPDANEGTIAHGVRDLRVSWTGSHAVFCVYDTLYTLRLDRPGARPEAIELVASGDTATLDHQRLTLDTKVTEAALSPDGKTMAVIARGEVFVRSTSDDRPTRRVTETPGRERGLAWSPDGTDLYFASDESGTWDLYRARVTLTRADLKPKEPDADEPEDDESPDDETPDQPVDLQGDDGVSGDWSCQVQGGDIPQGAMGFSMTLTLKGDHVTGTISVPGVYEGPIEGDYDEATGTISIDMELGGQPVSMVMTISDGSMTGTASLGDLAYTISGERAKPVTANKTEEEPDEPGDDETSETSEKKSTKKDDVGQRWAEALRFEVELLVSGATNDRAPLPSPDGRLLLFVRGLGDLVVMDLTTGEQRTVLEGWSEPEVVWAGDSRQIVFARQDLDFNSDIWLLDVLDPDSKPFNITRHPDIDHQPRLSADGKVLVFLSDRAGDNWDFDVWAVYLDKSLESLPAYELKEHFKDAAATMKKRKPLDPIEPANEEDEESDDDSDAGEDDAADEEDALPEAQKLDVDDAYLRVRKLTSFPGGEDDLALTPAGDRIIFSGRVNGTAGLYSIDHTGGERKTVASGSASNVAVTLKGDQVSYVSGGQARTAKAEGGDAKTYKVRARIEIDIAQQQRQKFLEAARVLGTRFYHPSLKGLDWPMLTERYLALAETTRTAAGFNRVTNMLFGELDGSHLGISGGDAYRAPSPAVGYLGARTAPAPGGYKIVRVLKGSPAEAVGLVAGDVILAIEDQRLADGDEVFPRIDLGAAMAGRSGVETLLEIRRASTDKEGDDEPDGGTAEDVDQGDSADEVQPYLLVTPISGGAMRSLLYKDEVDHRRTMVDELSGGTLGYLHIRGMNEPSVRDFERDLYAAAYGKEGLVIDVRDNGGGWTTDILLSSLTAPRHAYTVPRGAREADALPNAYPRDRRLIYAYQRPLSVLINQNSFSNAEIFAHAIRTTRRGKLVGTQTFGGVISTGSASLIDGTRVRTPFRGWYLPDGTDMEEHGAKPDIAVAQTPADEIARRDEQLRAAVEELMDRVARSPDGLWHRGQ